MTNKNDVKVVELMADSYKEIRKEIARIIIGQDEILEKLLIGLYARGHCLLVGVPGLAKTLIIKTLGEVLGLSFSRIQFTPDLMPSDITGSEVLEEDRTTGKKVFRFLKGPVFANIILADEINRTPPKTQSALLEAMQEQKVTIGNESYALDVPFYVLATQNPIEQEGTYPLPEAQLDRFMFSLWLDYPEFGEEVQIVKQTTQHRDERINKVIGQNDILKFQAVVKDIPVADNTIEYAVKLVNATRHSTGHSDEKLKNWIRWGAGPRASQFLILGAKVRAALEKRFTPNIDDVRFMAASVLRHRLIPSFNAEAEGISVEEIINYLLEKIN